MQRSAFIIVLFSLLAFFSNALASPLPVQAIKEMREVAAELSAREVPVEHQILRREATADDGPVINLNVLAREHGTFEGYVEKVNGETNVARDTQDLEPRICRGRMCI